MKVIGAGFGRTGTLSMKTALERLGFGPCFHMSEVFTHPERISRIRAAAAGEPVDLDEVFAGYSSTVDWPGCWFWRELADRYPDAKVLLSVRDPQRWYASVRDTIYQSSAMARELPDEEVLPAVAEGRALVADIVWQRQFGGRGGDPEHAIRTFTDHNEAVIDEVPAERLLVHRSADGWPPLCEFLGVPVPDEPFPHLNDGDHFRQRMADRLAGGAPRIG